MDPEIFVGEKIHVTANEDDDFHDFVGTCIGVRNGFLQVKDQDDDVYEVEVSQISISV